MPVKSKAQERLMNAAAHTKGGYGGVPQKVGKEFVKADKGKDMKKLPEHVTPKKEEKKKEPMCKKCKMPWSKCKCKS